MGVKLKAKIKVKGDISKYRNKVLGLSIKDFRALQAGGIVEVDEEKAKLKVLQEVKDGD